MGHLIDRVSGQPVFKFATSLVDVIGIENGGNDANSLGAGGKDFVNVIEIDAANGEPGNGHVCGGPPDVIKGHRFGAGLSARGINGAVRDVIRPCSDGFAGLLG